MKKLYKNLSNSIMGIKFALAEHSFQLELILGVPVIVTIIFSPAEKWEMTLLFVLYCLLLVLEIQNTAIEFLCDRVSKKQEFEIGRIKDLASASVFIILLCTLFFLIKGIYSWIVL